MKVIFFGSSDFSIPFLKSILNSKHRIVLVVTGTEQARGRGRRKTPNPVKVFAEDSGLCFFEVESLDSSKTNRILSERFDYLVLVSFGKILPPALIDGARGRTVNVHPSLLPRYRGPSPIITALLNGDSKTGVSLIKISHSVDEGDIYMQKDIDILEDDNKATLEKKIVSTGTSMLVTLLDLIEGGEVKTRPQSSSGISYTRIFNKDDLKLDWNRTPIKIFNKIRAFSESPGCFTFWNDKNIKILASRVDKIKKCSFNPEVRNGAIVSADKSGLSVKCGDRFQLSILKLQPAGRKVMSYVDFINGYKIKAGDFFE